MRLWLIVGFLPMAASGATPARVEAPAFAQALAFGNDLVPMYQGHYYRLRLIDAPETDGECWGSEKSCPKHTLYLAVMEGELYPKTAVYMLGVATGWEFLGWKENCAGKGTVGFSVRTDLPGANVEPDQRATWTSRTIVICIDDGTPQMTQALPNQPLHPDALTRAGERRR